MRPEFGKRIHPDILTAVQHYLPDHNHPLIEKDEVIDHLCAAGDCLWETLVLILRGEDFGSLDYRHSRGVSTRLGDRSG